MCHSFEQHSTDFVQSFLTSCLGEMGQSTLCISVLHFIVKREATRAWRGKGKSRDITKLDTDCLFEWRSDSEWKQKIMENFPGKTISSCSRHKCDHRWWEPRNGTGRRTLHFHRPHPSSLLKIFTLSRFLSKSPSLCHGDEPTLQTWRALNT